MDRKKQLSIVIFAVRFKKKKEGRKFQDVVQGENFKGHFYRKVEINLETSFCEKKLLLVLGFEPTTFSSVQREGKESS